MATNYNGISKARDILIGVACVALSVNAIEASWESGIIGHAFAGSDEREGLLVGYGCTDARGAIYAVDESDFPACGKIEYWQP